MLSDAHFAASAGAVDLCRMAIAASALADVSPASGSKGFSPSAPASGYLGMQI